MLNNFFFFFLLKYEFLECVSEHDVLFLLTDLTRSHVPFVSELLADGIVNRFKFVCVSERSNFGVRTGQF
jgi:hypothetical protein